MYDTRGCSQTHFRAISIFTLREAKETIRAGPFPHCRNQLTNDAGTRSRVGLVKASQITCQ
jgi:hypothetical protein